MAIALKNAINADVAATREDLYTCPGATEAVMLSLQVSNIDGTNAAYIDVELYDSSTTTYVMVVENAEVLPGGSLSITDKVVLEASDKISLTANAAGDLSAVGSFMEKT
jgi:hypothetical protein